MTYIFNPFSLLIYGLFLFNLTSNQSIMKSLLLMLSIHVVCLVATSSILEIFKPMKFSVNERERFHLTVGLMFSMVLISAYIARELLPLVN